MEDPLIAHTTILTKSQGTLTSNVITDPTEP